MGSGSLKSISRMSVELGELSKTPTVYAVLFAFWFSRIWRSGSRKRLRSVRSGCSDFELWPIKRSLSPFASFRAQISASTPIQPTARASYNGTRRM